MLYTDPENYISSLSEKYTIVQTLGKGSYGKVVHCFNSRTHEEVAVKALIKSRIVRDEVLNELSIISSIQHPHIVEFRAVYENEKYIFIEMELLKGGTLKNQMDNHGAMSESVAAKIMK